MELKKLKDIEKSVEQTAKKLEKVDGELTGLKNVSYILVLCWFVAALECLCDLTVTHLCLFFQGFLAKDLQAEALGKLDHRVKIAAEQFMKILEQIDAMVIYCGLGVHFECIFYSYITCS